MTAVAAVAFALVSLKAAKWLLQRAFKLYRAIL